MNFNCYLCNEFFSRRENLQRHHRTYHLNETAKRYTCSLNNEHVDCSPNLPPVTEEGITRRISSHAFGKFTRNIRFTSDIDHQSLEFMTAITTLVEKTLQILRDEKSALKLSSTLCVMFEKLSGDEQNDEAYFSEKAIHLDNYNFDKVIELIENKVENYTKRGSNWIIIDTKFFEMNVIAYKM